MPFLPKEKTTVTDGIKGVISMKKRLLYIDNSVNKEYQPADDWTPYFTLPYDIVHPPAGEIPVDLDRYTHILISGALPGVLEEDDWQGIETSLIQTAVKQKKAMLGVCYGHQLIAKTLFGTASVCTRSAIGQPPEIGWTKITILADDPLFGKRGESYWGYVSHYDDVCHVPAEMADIIAASPACPIQAFKLKGLNIWGVQAHFEIGLAAGSRYLHNKLKKNPQLAEVILSEPRDSGFIDLLMRRFQALAV